MLRRLGTPFLLCLALQLAGAAAFAQMPVVQADRPGEATPPVLIPKGAIQVEAGVQLTRETHDDDPDTDTLEVPDLLLRIGVLERLELRLEADGLLYEFRDGATDRALGSDLTVAAKVRLLDRRGFVPMTSVLLGLSLPTGSKAATSDGVDPQLEGLYGWKLGEDTALVVNTGFSVPTQGSDDDRRIFQFDPSASIERQITPTIGGFIEYFGEVKTGGVADEHSLDAGFTWLVVARKVQLDVSAGAGLNEAAPDWFVSAGITMRISAPWAR